MTDPTQLNPTVGGAPPAGPPPDGPPTGGPPGDGPDGSGGDGGMDRRLVAILGLLGAIIVLLAILLFVIANDDGDDDPTVPSSTTTTLATTTTTTAPTTTEATTTTTTEATTTTASTTTTVATTTTTTTEPPPTIAPARCTGTDAADDPDDTAIVFYDAWTIDDTDCAARVASDDAIDTLFTADGSGADWSFEGCADNGVGRERIECAFRYEGGAAFFEMRVDAEDRWEVASVRFRAD